ncbi:MAG: PDZ domain-containing protein [Gemmataceae bacterium]
MVEVIAVALLLSPSLPVGQAASLSVVRGGQARLLVLREEKTSYIGVQIRKGDDDTFLIQAVLNDSPAEKAELKPGDVIVKINGVKPTDLPTAVKVIQALKPGKKVKFLIKRDGKEKEIDVTPVARDG